MTATAIVPALLRPRRSFEHEAVERAHLTLLRATGVRPLVQYQRDPIGFAVDVLRVPERTIRWSLNTGYDAHAWDGDADPHVKVFEALAAGHNVAVESATGTQKTFNAAVAAAWFVGCFENALVVTAAPKEAQLTLHLWKELGRQWPRFAARFPSADLTQLRLRMKPLAADADGWAVHGFACGVNAGEESATKAQGFHAEHMLIVTEETPGVSAAVMTAFENTCTAPHNLRLALGNPDHQLDELHRFATAAGTVAVRISALDHPNVVCDDAAIVPGAVSRKKIDERRANYGEESRLYQSRVRGICPAEASDSLISLTWLEAAWQRAQDAAFLAAQADGVQARGVDVANSENGDKASIARGRGALLLSVTAFACPDANVLGTEMADECERDGIDPKHVGVDTVGVGAGTFNEMKRLGKRPQALNGGASQRFIAGQEEQFNNLRSQMYWQFRMDLQHGRVAIAIADRRARTRLFQQLVQATYTTKNGAIVVESKETIKKRLGGKSPDEADSVVYWNWARQRFGGVPDLAPLHF